MSATQEVLSSQPESAASDRAGVRGPARARRAIGAWLLVCAGLVCAVTVLGGITRLTHSGLSIVTWEPLAGVLPPLTEQEWEEEFAHYREFPEYQQINRGMDLAGFKSIYWVEYTHRMAARLVGVVFAVPFVYFLLRRWLRQRFAWQLFGVLLLGGAQGVMGWLMVASGLVDRPDVSHYRLTAHLGLAMVVYVLLIWLALRVLAPPSAARAELAPAGFRGAALGAVGLVLLLILSGGLVAGLDAGFAFNTFPKMDGAWIPAAVLDGWPFANIAAVQFAHRWLGILVAAFLVLLWGRAIDLRLPPRALWAFHGLVAAVAVQGVVGILTLLYVVPMPLASAHQAVALVVLGLATVAAYGAGSVPIRPPRARARMSAAWLYLTAASREEAETIGRVLVEERLAACANVLGAIRSFYRWEGVLCEDDETALVVKTRRDLVRAVVARTKELHSYSCPCVVALPIADGNPEFLSWVEQETRHDPPEDKGEVPGED